MKKFIVRNRPDDIDTPVKTDEETTTATEEQGSEE
jgi:hypothetical protein